MQSILKFSVHNQYEVLRTPGVDNEEKFSLAKWQLKTNHNTYRLFPKSLLILGCLIGWYRYEQYYSKKREQSEKESNLKWEQSKELGRLRQEKYQEGYNDGIAFLTKNKISKEVLSSYMDFIVLSEDRKNQRLQEPMK